MRSFFFILFLSLIYNFACGQAIIQGINYDESKVPDFVLPDPLICNDGQQVTTADEWEKIRRPEILEIFMSKSMDGRRLIKSMCLIPYWLVILKQWMVKQLVNKYCSLLQMGRKQ